MLTISHPPGSCSCNCTSNGPDNVASKNVITHAQEKETLFKKRGRKDGV